MFYTCLLSVHDPDRSVCDAPEQDGLWYAHYWESRRKESEGSTLTPFVAPTSNNQSLEKFAKRDVVLQTLLSRSEGTARKTATQSTNTWISKYAFSKETVQAADELEATAKPNKVKSSSSKKKKEERHPGVTKRATRVSPRNPDESRKGASLIVENAGRDKAAPANTSDVTGRQDASPMQERIPRKTGPPESSRQIDHRESSGSDRNSRRKSAPVGLPERDIQRGAVKEEKSSQANGKPASRLNRQSLPAQSSSMNETTEVGKKRKSSRLLKPSVTKISKSTSDVKVPSTDPETIDLCLDSDSD